MGVLAVKTLFGPVLLGLVRAVGFAALIRGAAVVAVIRVPIRNGL
jgi:hypothetical protein